MQLVDSHCHINFEPLANKLPDLLTNAAANDVAYMLCVSVNLEDFPEVLALAHTHANIFASAGVHPNSLEGAEPDVATLVKLAGDPKVVAIGETGLDYFRSTGDLDWQRDRFRVHIAAARESGKSLIIHTRDAADDTMQILREHLRSDQHDAPG